MFSQSSIHILQNMSNNEQTQEEKKEPMLQVPISILRWFLYSIFFCLLLLPFWLGDWRIIFLSLILAHFAGQLNNLKAKE